MPEQHPGSTDNLKETHALDPAENFDKSIAGKYRVTTALYLRAGAGKDKGALAVMPEGAEVMYAMKTLRRCSIVAHVHDEIIVEGDSQMSLDDICEKMGRTPPWAEGLVLRADGYVCDFYKKD